MRRLLPERGVVLQQYMASETTSEPRDGSGLPRGQLGLEGDRVGLKHPQGHGEDDGVGLEGLPYGEGRRENVRKCSIRKRGTMGIHPTALASMNDSLAVSIGGVAGPPPPPPDRVDTVTPFFP